MKLSQKIAVKYVKAKLNFIGMVSKEKAAEKAFEIFCTPRRRSKKKPHGIFDQAEKLSFEFEGLKIKGYRFNHPAETKVLIIHGFESSSKNFFKYIQPLIDKGYEVLAFDGPAHGRSEGSQIQIPLYLKMLEKIIDLYGPIQRFMGHSFGGLALALLLEKLQYDLNTKAVLIAPATETTTSIQQYFKLLDIDPEVQQLFEKIILDRSGVPSSWFSISRAASHIKADMLWIHDKEDDLTPYHDAHLVKNCAYPNFKFIVTKGLGHRKIYKDDNVMQKIIHFL